MLYDLSHRIEDGMPVYPGDLPVTVRQNRHFEQDGFNNSVLTFGPHVGTHVDGLMHMSDHPVVIADQDPERFCGPAVTFDVRGIGEVGPDAIDWSRVSPDDIVLLCTGHDIFFGKESYFADHPIVTADFAAKLVAHGVKLLGVDLPSPDVFPFPVHKRLFGAGIFLVENLTGLEALISLPKVTFYGFPLKLQADSSPIRAVACSYCHRI